MKRSYENFTEMAEDFKNGENWTHVLSDHSEENCFAWQEGIIDFAKWLDSSGVKIVDNPEIYKKLWEIR